MLARAKCLFGGHRPIRNRVHSEGVYLTGTCKTCGAPIWRNGPGDWRHRE